MTKIEGGCLCGAVRYVATAEPLLTRACWCRVCQFIAAGNASVNAAFATDTLSITGDLRDFPSIADSGSHMHRRFCPSCGVHLFTVAEERPHITGVRVGTLDNPERVKPQAVIWTSAAPPWAVLDPTVPHFEGQAPAPAVKQ